MNILYSSSDSYAEICGISMTSLFENNKEVTELTVYLVDNDISEKNKARLNATAEKYGRELVFISKIDLRKLANTDIYEGRWNIGTFFRLYAASLLPETVDRVINIDCDTIIRHSLEAVYDLDMGDCLAAAADDCRSDLYRIELGCEPGIPYVNNGFLMIDLKKWRECNLEADFTKFIAERKGDLTYMDQAPLNGILGLRNQIHEIEPKYNAQRIFFDFTYEELLKLRKPEHHLSIEAYNEALSDPIVVHFTPTFYTGTRPWNVKDGHKFTPEYLHYKSISEWKDEPQRPDNRKLPKKIMTVICRLTPKFIMLPIMAYLHAVWYPKKRIKIRDKNMAIEAK